MEDVASTTTNLFKHVHHASAHTHTRQSSMWLMIVQWLIMATYTLLSIDPPTRNTHAQLSIHGSPIATAECGHGK